MGRPRKSIALKAAQGDTRKVGALRFAEEIAGAYVARRGAPPYPEEFRPQKLAPALKDNPEEQARHAATEARRARAAAHYDYLIRSLDTEGLLCHMDGGILASMGWLYALITEAAESGNARGLPTLHAAYLTASNATGFNESARAKIPKPAKAELSAEEAGLAAELPPDADAPFVQ